MERRVFDIVLGCIRERWEARREKRARDGEAKTNGFSKQRNNRLEGFGFGHSPKVDPLCNETIVVHIHRENFQREGNYASTAYAQRKARDGDEATNSTCEINS